MLNIVEQFKNAQKDKELVWKIPETNYVFKAGDGIVNLTSHHSVYKQVLFSQPSYQICLSYSVREYEWNIRYTEKYLNYYYFHCLLI